MITLAVLLALGAVPAESARALPAIGDGDGGFRLTEVGRFAEPTHVAGAPGRKNRKLLFVVEQGGRVMVIRGGASLPTPFLDIRDRVLSGGEEGLLSIAFHPGYERNRRFYVYFTDTQGDNEVVEFRRSKRSRVRANPATAREVLHLPHPTFGNHNGGQLQFGPKRLLYIAPGDGGSGGDPPNNAQNPDSLLGKLLRIDPLPKRKGKRRKGKRRSAGAAGRPRRTGSREGTPSSAGPDGTRYSRSACAIPTGSASTSSTGRSRSATSARDAGRRSTTAPRGTPAGPISAGPASRGPGSTLRTARRRGRSLRSSSTTTPAPPVDVRLSAGSPDPR